MTTQAEIKRYLKRDILIDTIELELREDEIDDEAPLFSPEGIGLDSIEALEVVVGLERKFGVSLREMEVDQRTAVLRSIETLSAAVLARLGGAASEAV